MNYIKNKKVSYSTRCTKEKHQSLTNRAQWPKRKKKERVANVQTKEMAKINIFCIQPPIGK